MEVVKGFVLDMAFSQRLVSFRKEKGLTQQALADRVGIHVIQIHRYESGTSQPSLEVIKKLAVALSITTDALLFDQEERGPSEDLKLQFEAVAKFDPEARQVAKTVLDGLILQHQARRLASGE
ncbi:MAG: helix-turn-helix transcriptional regulator [Thermoanaerobaculales bacterium]|nr:helix-turn-helix transcriptional regulator [Thermoanaerobaculales bacterium]